MSFFMFIFIAYASCFEDATPDSPAKAADGEADAGSFTKLTHAAEALASHAASQAAGLFSYKKVEEEKAQELLTWGYMFHCLQWELLENEGGSIYLESN